FYFAAARIGLAHGWPAIYDLNLQQAELDALGSGIKIAELARYISPPPVASSALPLTALPYPAAYWTWSGLLLVTLGLTLYPVALGPGGIGAYEARLSFAAGVPVNRELTLAYLIGDVTLTRAVQALIAAWSLVLAYRMRRRGPEWVFVCALVGGMLATPYVHL